MNPREIFECNSKNGSIYNHLKYYVWFEGNEIHEHSPQEMAVNVVGEQRFSSTQSQAQSEGDTEMGI